MIQGAVTRSRANTLITEKDDEMAGNDNPSGYENGDGEPEPEATLLSIFKELKEFRKDNKQQLSEIKSELNKTNDRLDEAEGRIGEAETVLEATTMLIKKLMQRQANLEAKLLDQEGRARRENLRVYGVPEDKEGNDMLGFLDNLFKDTLGLPRDMELRIERAHRALAPKPNDPQLRPRSIIVKFGSYKTKEEIIRRAWQKKTVLCDNTRYYVDHDFPPEVLKKRGEYAEAKKLMKEKKIKFQTPYPARMRVFYEDGTRLYQNATEATRDMATRGFPIAVVKHPMDPDQEEIQRLSTWQTVGIRRGLRGDVQPAGAGSSTQQMIRGRHIYMEKLQGFRR